MGERKRERDIGRQIKDGEAEKPTEAHRTAACLAAYLAVYQDRNIPGTVVETLAKDIQRVLKPRHDYTRVMSGLAGVAREVGQICAALPTNGNKNERQQISYTRNLLNGLLPDGYLGSTPAEIERFFAVNWRRLNLPNVHRTTGNG